jgi:hypothetical protein
VLGTDAASLRRLVQIRGRTARQRQGKDKRFFFEKKNQKTFASLGWAHPVRPQPNQSKVFCFFFSKKKALLPLVSEDLGFADVRLERRQVTRRRWLVAFVVGSRRSILGE